jgi:hypothetical protein
MGWLTKVEPASDPLAFFILVLKKTLPAFRSTKALVIPAINDKPKPTSAASAAFQGLQEALR